MPHELPKSYDPSQIEAHWAEYWVKEKLFHVDTPAAVAAAATGGKAQPAGAARSSR